LIISNDIQNEYGKWVVVVVLTSQDVENIEPFEVLVEKTKEIKIDKNSKLKLNYPQTLDKGRLKEYLGAVNRKIMEQAKAAWQIAFDMDNW
jgi:mRNA-degrading endonuclease toxin of MazEF toxin-antitoxin module